MRHLNKFSRKLGWGNIIGKIRLRVRQQTAMINSIKFGGFSSLALCRVLFSTFVLPFFTWLFAIFPLLTSTQRTGLNHFYYTSLKRVYHSLCWKDLFFASVYNERSLDDVCYAYRLKYCKPLASSRDAYLLLEQFIVSTHRSKWEEGNLRIKCLRSSKRFVRHYDVFGLATWWMAEHGMTDSVPVMDDNDFELFATFSETF